MRVVASLTTMPDRYDKIIFTLKTLHQQTYKLDAIYLSLPKISRRLSIPYPELPEDIQKLCTVVSCDDYGPMTKILGGIIMESDPNTVIITFDDDKYYEPDLVEKLMEKHKLYPNSALGSSGMLLKYLCPFCSIAPNENTFIYRTPKFKIPSNGRKVDSIYGYPGALYIRRFFPSNDRLDDLTKYAMVDNNTYLNDDITISGYLSLHGIERRIFKNMPIVKPVYPSGVAEHSPNEISYNLPQFFKRMNRAIKTCKTVGLYNTTESVDVVSESIVGIVFIIILCIVVIFAMAMVIIKNDQYLIDAFYFPNI